MYIEYKDKTIYGLKNKLKEEVLAMFDLWQLVEPFDYEEFENEDSKNFKKEQRKSNLK